MLHRLRCQSPQFKINFALGNIDRGYTSGMTLFFSNENHGRIVLDVQPMTESNEM